MLGMYRLVKCPMINIFLYVRCDNKERETRVLRKKEKYIWTLRSCPVQIKIQYALCFLTLRGHLSCLIA